MTRTYCGLALVVACLSMPVAAADTVAIVGGTLIDGNGGPPVANAVVVVIASSSSAAGRATPRTVTCGA